MRAAVLLALACSIVSSVALAGNANDVLDDVRNDARRNAENSARQVIFKQFPYNGSLYGLPGQTRSSSIRESAIRSALGGMFGSCKKSGLIDIKSGGLNMEVGAILANTEIKVPEINTHVGGSGGLLGSLSGLIPKPSEISAAGDKVKVGGSWISAQEYQSSVAQTQAELLKQQAAANASKTPPAAAQSKSTSPTTQTKQAPAVSKIWGAAK